VARWIFTHGYGRAVREVGDSNPIRGTIVRSVFNPTRQLARFSPPNMPSIVNYKYYYYYYRLTILISLQVVLKKINRQNHYFMALFCI